ncbi:DNA pol/primase, large sub [Giardia lamblia P15]|uniref:DNA pol/primase, large sub n=1 Tax=Giardia intestinalis (strain P15) TaxID=658858 RepID=E1F586_GIAIA|nr:DNA pol/primase, large sub [Giardia lamblia P15]
MEALSPFSQLLRPDDFSIFKGSVLVFEKEAVLRLKILQKLDRCWRGSLKTELLENYPTIISNIGMVFAENGCNYNWLVGLPFSTDQDTRSYWLLRFAFASDKNAWTWHMNCERILAFSRFVHAFLAPGSHPRHVLSSLGGPHVPFNIKSKSEGINCLLSFYLYMVSDLLISDENGPILFTLDSISRLPTTELANLTDDSDREALQYIKVMCLGLVQEIEYIELSLSTFYLTRREQFSVCTELAAKRVPCVAGMFLLAAEDLISLLLIKFAAIYKASQSICASVSDIRIPQFAELLEILRQTRIDSNSLEAKVQLDEDRKLSRKNIDAAIRAGCIPPCMLYCINGLKANNRLKYQARLQLTSFFNSCGMSCEDDLEYQKSFYTRVIPEEKFNREYAYNIKHIHGKVGGRKPTMCRGCNTIGTLVPIGDRSGQQLEVHGCPFVHMYDKNAGDPTRLKTFLQNNYRVTAYERDIEDKILCAVSNHQDKGWLGYITAPLREGEPKVACNHLFELVHGDVRIDLMHPVKFFKESTNIVAQRPIE